jgi:uncharacterized Zn finger protein
VRNANDSQHVPVTPLGREWVEWLMQYPVGGERLAQSLELLKSGRVGELKVDGGSVEAEVKDVLPFQVVLHFLPVEREQWDLLGSLVNAEAWRDFGKGVIGPVLQNAFAVAEVDLLPERYKHVKTICTCPDWMRPCPHALAVLRALGEEMERDPVLLLRLRGGGPREDAEVLERVADDGEALRTDALSFWGNGSDWTEFEERLLAGGEPARLLKRLGPVSVYGVRMEPDSMFKPVYEGVAAEAKVMLEGIRKKVKK